MTNRQVELYMNSKGFTLKENYYSKQGHHSIKHTSIKNMDKHQVNYTIELNKKSRDIKGVGVYKMKWFEIMRKATNSKRRVMYHRYSSRNITVEEVNYIIKELNGNSTKAVYSIRVVK